MMRILAKILESTGITLLFAGGAGMDSASLIAPSILAFVGIIIALAGVYIEEGYVWQQ